MSLVLCLLHISLGNILQKKSKVGGGLEKRYKREGGGSWPLGGTCLQKGVGSKPPHNIQKH